MPTLDETNANLKSAVEAARAIAETAEKENRDFTGDERKALDSHMEEARKLKGQQADLAKTAQMRQDLKNWGTELGLQDRAPGPLASGAPLAPSGNGGSLGEKFVNSAAFKGFLSQFPNGRIPESAKGIHSAPVEFGGFKDLLTSANHGSSAGNLVQPVQLGFQDQPWRPLVMRDLIASGTIGTDSLEYVRQGTRRNNAAFIPEATTDAAIGSTVGGTAVTALAGGLKPQSGFDLEKVTESVKTMAHWMAATKRSLSDAGQIRTMIDQFLRNGLEQKLEDQILLGAGTGEDFTGILNTPGTTNQGFDTDLLVTTRRAKTLARLVGRSIPTAFVFNPEDNERIDLLRDGNGGTPNSGSFLFGGPAGNGVQTLWGLPRVESEAMPVGTGMVADWRYAVLWDREQASIQVSDSHSDFFVRNLVAFLAEMRAAFGILRPAAFVEIDLTA